MLVTGTKASTTANNGMFTRQPCNPNMVEARDAILDADTALTGGANACEIWTGFAKRGLGESAKYALLRRTESFDVPSGVC